MTRFYKAVKAFVTPFAKGLFRFEVIGAENFKKSSNLIICCNHQSFWDVVLLAVACPFQINFMAKKELFKNKLIGWIFTKVGAFPVNRGAGDLNAFKKAHVALNGGILGIFPEGTRNPLGAPGKAKAGAAMLAIDTGADILPVAIRYSAHPILFRKVSVRIGEIINGDDFVKNETVSKSEIRRVTSLIMESITMLWEKKF